MESVVLQKVINKTYFLADRTIWGQYYRIPVDFERNNDAYLGYKEEIVGWDIILESKDFTRELKIEELIHIEGKNYGIEKVSHTDDGKILYYIKKESVNEDLDSKKKAEQDLETRKLILAERSKQVERQDSDRCYYSDGCSDTVASNKKWYQIWK